MKDEVQDKIVNITKIEKMTGKSYHTLKRWVENKDFPMYKEGGQWVLHNKDYTDWCQCQKEGKKYEKPKKKTRQTKKKAVE